MQKILFFSCLFSFAVTLGFILEALYKTNKRPGRYFCLNHLNTFSAKSIEKIVGSVGLDELSQAQLFTSYDKILLTKGNSMAQQPDNVECCNELRQARFFTPGQKLLLRSLSSEQSSTKVQKYSVHQYLIYGAKNGYSILGFENANLLKGLM